MRNKQGYPYNGRGASDEPNFWSNLLSFLPNWVPWEYFIIPLNSKLDIWLNKLRKKNEPNRPI